MHTVVDDGDLLGVAWGMGGEGGGVLGLRIWCRQGMHDTHDGNLLGVAGGGVGRRAMCYPVRDAVRQGILPADAWLMVAVNVHDELRTMNHSPTLHFPHLPPPPLPLSPSPTPCCSRSPSPPLHLAGCSRPPHPPPRTLLLPKDMVFTALNVPGRDLTVVVPE